MQTQERPVSLKSGHGFYNPPPAQRLLNGWLEHRHFDYVLLGAILGLGYLASLRFHYFPLNEISGSDRHAIYQIAAQVSAALGGFTLTSVSVLVNLLRTPLAAIDKVLPPEDKRVIGNAFVGCLPATALVFFCALVGFIWDQGKMANPFIEGVFVCACMLSLLRFGRIVGILKVLLPVAS